MNSISIIGAGWLGMALARQLQQKGHNIVLAKRQQADVTALLNQGWQAETFTLGEDIPFALCANTAVVNIPPKRRTVNPSEFTKHMCALFDTLIENGTQHIIFISTTSVYGEQQGKLDQDSDTKPTTDSGKAHLHIEQHLLKTYPIHASVLRLAGLVGGERHPIKSLSGKTNLSKPTQCVNLVHRTDVISAINAIIEKQIWGETLVLCSAQHPTRKDYYTWAAEQLSLVAPTFLQEDLKAPAKQIDSTKTLAKLGIKLAFPSPYDMIPLV